MFQTGLLDDFASWYTDSLTEDVKGISEKMSKDGYSDGLATEVTTLRDNFIGWMIALWGDEA